MIMVEIMTAKFSETFRCIKKIEEKWLDVVVSEMHFTGLKIRIETA